MVRCNRLVQRRAGLMADEWAVVTPKGQVRLGDLTLDALVGVEAEVGEEWWRVLAHPVRSAKVARALYLAACAHVEVEPEALTVRQFADGLFVQVPEDLPDVYQGGLPKAEDGAQTSGSSGVPSDSSGPLTKSEG